MLDLEYLIYRKLDFFIFKSLETNLREILYLILIFIFKMVLNFRVVFYFGDFCIFIYLYFNLSMGNNNEIEII